MTDQPIRTPQIVRALHALAVDMRDDGVVDSAFLGPQAKDRTKAGKTLAVFVNAPRAADDSLDLAPGFSGDAYVETNEVGCLIESWSGGADPGAHMDACGVVYDALRDRVEADMTLGGICNLATMGRRRSWSADQGQRGVIVSLSFTVRVQAYVG